MFTVTNPTTGKTLYQKPSLTSGEMNQRIEASYQAWQEWRTSNFSQRAEVLIQVARLMRENVEMLAAPMTEEMGKPIKEARAEVIKAAWCAEHYAEHAEAYLMTQTLSSDAAHSYVQHMPLGPVLGVLPWNAPFWLAFRFCAPALMAGNTCLMKHDPHVPGCSEAITNLFQQAGIPEHIMQNLPLQTEDVEAAIRHPRVQAVSFTGSGKAGGIVASIAASEIKPSVLELGGSDPAIVLADADQESAADAIAISRMINAGQSCIAAKRIIVEAPIYESFIEKLKLRLEKLKMGDPKEEATDIGPIARQDLRDNLDQQVQQTIASGARCLLGGKIPERDGFFYPPTLLVDVRNEMRACQEETFGPIAVVIKAENADQALAIANDTEYGLAASVWTETKRGEMLASNIMAGQVVVNGIVKTDPRLPSGGIKRSGFGRELGPHGIMAFVNVQQVWVGPKTD